MKEVRRYYQLARFRPRTASENLALVMKFETQSSWSSRELRGFGSPTPEVIEAAESWLELLKQNASLLTDPLPVMSVDRYLWEGLYEAFRSPVNAITLGPLLAIQDLASMIHSLTTGFQPFLNDKGKTLFQSWLNTKEPNVRQALLTFMWTLPRSGQVPGVGRLNV